ncbi:choice-of-anchor J domain-containing protein [Dokdonella sp.]|uniref:choice-of-anchor J domain-containing protein n=1 Tax=Dokdonella sp. TaxID=2291710 RepID=UPI001B013992|nr:choice-of-anchor J domain-containing protein [Dokdonella sp.]MBO9663958.1 choice-of-anchor J domain-containing protein [Dokdonella sp.]
MTRQLGLLAGAAFAFAANAVAVPLAVTEGFEQTGAVGIYANGWIRQDNSEFPPRYGMLGHSWHRQSPYAYTAYDAPPQSFIVPFNPLEVPEDGVVSAWLLSPPIAFGESFSLSFFARSLIDPELGPAIDRLQVRLCGGSACTDVGTAPGDVGAFDRLLLDINADEAADAFPGEWTKYEVGPGPNVPTSGVGRIAFRYYVRQTPSHLASGRLGLDRVVIGADPNGTAGLSLAVTATPYDPAAPDACNGAGRIEATLGDRINLCYEVTNTSTETLRHHWLRDDRVGAILDADPRELVPGASYRYNRVITVGRSETISATATSQTRPQDYVVDDSQPADYIDVSDGELVTPGEVAQMPFDFRFYRKTTNFYCVTNDGVFATSMNGQCPDRAVVGAIPSGDSFYVENSPFAAVYATKLWPHYGSIHRKLIGTAPNRKLVIQWYQKVPATIAPGQIDPSRGLDAELILHEGTDQLEYQYRNTRFGALPQEDDGGTASIGVQKDLHGIRYSYQAPSLATVRRIVWTPATPSVHVDSRTLDVVGLASELHSSTGSVAANLPSHGSGRVQLGIGNAGAGRLDWSSGTAPAGHALFPASASMRAQRDNLLSTAQELERPLFTFDLNNDFSGIGYGSLVRFNPAHPDYLYPTGAISSATLDGRLIYAIAFADDDFGSIYAIDHYTHELMRWSTGEQPVPGPRYEVIGTVPLLLDWIAGMRQDPTTGTMYLATSEGSGSALWTLDLATASVHPVGAIANAPQLADLAFDSQGQLYAVDDALGSLLMIDKHTGEAIVIGPLDPSAVGALAFDYDPALGKFYLLSSLRLSDPGSGALWTVDPSSAVTELQAEIFGIDFARALWQSLAVARRTSACTAPRDVPWLSLSPPDGSIAAGGPNQTLGIDFDGAGLADGTYEANLCLYSNDPMRRRLTLPVRLSLGADSLFADGFESLP